MSDYVKMALVNKAGKTLPVWVERINDGTLIPKVGTRTNRGDDLSIYKALGWELVEDSCAAQHNYKYKLYSNSFSSDDAYWFYKDIKATTYEDALARITEWIETYCDNAVVSIVSVKRDKDKVLTADNPVVVRLQPVADTPSAHTVKSMKWRVCFYRKSERGTKNVIVRGRTYKQVVHGGYTEDARYETFEGTREQVTEYIRRVVKGGNGFTEGYAEVA